MIKIENKTKKHVFEIYSGSQSVLVANRKDVTETEMRKDLKRFTDKYEIEPVMEIPVKDKSKSKVHRIDKRRPHKKEPEIPSPDDRKKEILESMQGEFGISDVADHFAGKGFDRKKIITNIRYDIRDLKKQGKLEDLGGSPKKYKVKIEGV